MFWKTLTCMKLKLFTFLAMQFVIQIKWGTPHVKVIDSMCNCEDSDQPEHPYGQISLHSSGINKVHASDQSLFWIITVCTWLVIPFSCDLMLYSHHDVSIIIKHYYDESSHVSITPVVLETPNQLLAALSFPIIYCCCFWFFLWGGGGGGGWVPRVKA